jgi:hypothetical protein
MPGVEAVRASLPIVWASLCGIGFGLRDGLKRCLRGMARSQASAMRAFSAWMSHSAPTAGRRLYLRKIAEFCTPYDAL